MCSVYNMYIQLQLNQKLGAITAQKTVIQSYLGELKKIKPYIEHYIDYSALLNGKISNLPEDIIGVIPNYKICNIVIKNYHKLYNTLLSYEAEALVLKKQKIKYNIYKDIISSFNKAIIKDMISTGNSFENLYFGSLEVYYKDQHNKSINWQESLKAKQAILDKGGEPYLRKNQILASKKGEEYNGEKWIVKREPRPLLSLKWRVAPKIISELGKEGANYKFFPARGNSGIISFFMSVYSNPNHNYQIYKTKC